jgi:hypothetical protein
MNTRRATKQFGPTREGSAVANRLADRYRDTTPVQQVDQPPASAPVDQPAVLADPARPARTRDTGMVTRSWYLPREVAADLDAAATELARQVPGATKHRVLAALIAAGLRHRDEVRAELLADVQRQLSQMPGS